MRSLKLITTSSCLVILLAGCAVNPETGRVGADPKVFNKDSLGSLGGGLLGAVICNQLFEGHGSRPGWTAACGIGGYFLSKSFLTRSSAAFEKNRVGETSSWVDPDGQAVSVTPTRTYYQDSGPCREYRTTVEIDGRTEVATGNACRQVDGTWRIQS
ncbi:MAG: hypothetical protein OEU36_15780 [Gammaproteobacteria bacterium]|nr:hypothetical protein [Gammaproteobacteria bacterium]